MWLLTFIISHQIWERCMHNLHKGTPTIRDFWIFIISLELMACVLYECRSNKPMYAMDLYGQNVDQLK